MSEKMKWSNQLSGVDPLWLWKLQISNGWDVGVAVCEARIVSQVILVTKLGKPAIVHSDCKWNSM